MRKGKPAIGSRGRRALPERLDVRLGLSEVSTYSQLSAFSIKSTIKSMSTKQRTARCRQPSSLFAVTGASAGSGCQA